MNNKVTTEEKVRYHRDVTRPLDTQNFIHEAKSIENISLQFEEHTMIIKHKNAVVYGIPMMRFNQGVMYARQWNAMPESTKWALGNIVNRYKNTRIEERGLFDDVGIKQTEEEDIV